MRNEKAPWRVLASILREIQETEGVSYRGLERLMYERTGERVTAAYMTNVIKGSVTAPRESEIRKLAAAFPDYSERLWAVVGMAPPDDPLPADVATELDRIARERGISRMEALRLALDGMTALPQRAARSRAMPCGLPAV